MFDAPANEIKTRVDVGCLAVSGRREEVLTAYALGSCVGVALYDSQAVVGGLAHIQLPSQANRHEVSSVGTWAYADVALPELFNRCFTLGAKKRRMKVVLAGGASILDPHGFFDIGRKNFLMVKKLLWKNGVFLTAERIGGQDWRTVSLEVGSGRVLVRSQSSQEEF